MPTYDNTITLWSKTSKAGNPYLSGNLTVEKRSFFVSLFPGDGSRKSAADGKVSIKEGTEYTHVASISIYEETQSTAYDYCGYITPSHADFQSLDLLFKLERNESDNEKAPILKGAVWAKLPLDEPPTEEVIEW